MSKTTKDFLSAALFLALGIIVMVFVPITIKDPGVTGVGPRTFPYFIGVCFILLSVTLGAQTLRKREKTAPTESVEQSVESDSDLVPVKDSVKRDELRVVASALVMLLYAIFFEKLGYFVSTGLMITAFLALLGTKKWHHYVISYGLALLVWAGFKFLLSVQLP